MTATIEGTVAPGFEAVAEAFRENFEVRQELGAAFAVWQGDRLVVDLWGGVADRDTDRPWEADTTAVVFSATKGMVAAAFLRLTDRGELDLDAPVSAYWPGFERHGKAGITVGMLLDHRAGLCAVDRRLRIEDVIDDPDATEAALLAQEPLWKPGTDQGYGATAWGLYVGALFRHVTGETVGAYFAREIAGPLGADVFLGTPRDQLARRATTYPVGPAEIARTIVPKILGTRLPGALRRPDLEGRTYGNLILDRSSDTHRAFIHPVMAGGGLKRVNEEALLTAELPWMNATASARGLATVYAALANKGSHRTAKVWRKGAIEALAAKASWAYADRVLGKPLGFNQGFQKEEPHLFSPHEASFGHTGAGGSFGWADPTHGLGFAYVCNRMDHHLRSPRATTLARSLYRCVDGFR